MDYRVFTDAISDKKGFDIKVLNISEISSFADYFVIATGNNSNQLQAICNNIQEKAHEAGYEMKMVEGYDKANWILLDYEDVIIHLFDKENRNFYSLDRLWRDAKIEYEE